MAAVALKEPPFDVWRQAKTLAVNIVFVKTMKFTERKRTLEYLLETIQKGRCVSLSQIALRLNVSSRTVKRMLAQLREEGHFIVYCKSSRKFYLKEKGDD